MKRIAIAIIVSLFVASVFVSCKSSEHCPAYGSSDNQQSSVSR